MTRARFEESPPCRSVPDPDAARGAIDGDRGDQRVEIREGLKVVATAVDLNSPEPAVRARSEAAAVPRSDVPFSSILGNTPPVDAQAGD